MPFRVKVTVSRKGKKLGSPDKNCMKKNVKKCQQIALWLRCTDSPDRLCWVSAARWNTADSWRSSWSRPSGRPRVEADLPAPVEDDLLVLVLVDVAEVDGVEVLQEVLVADPEAAVVKGFSVEFPSIWREKKKIRMYNNYVLSASLMPPFSPVVKKTFCEDTWVFNHWTKIYQLWLTRRSLASLQKN
jgi:hypothetical protein